MAGITLGGEDKHMLDESVMRNIVFAKYLFTMAKDHINSQSHIKIATGLHLLQDSVEIFLIAVADHKSATVTKRASINTYIDEINKKGEGNSLPSKRQILKLNNLRISSKHYASLPAGDECRRLVETVHNFFINVSSDWLEVQFETASLLSIVNDSETKSYLLEAYNYLSENNYVNCLIWCRKALYSIWGRDFDISGYRDFDWSKEPTTWLNTFIIGGMRAPIWSKREGYIEENVKNPFDYIVYNHDEIEKDLNHYRIDHNDFWNVMRLTPDVYQDQKDKEWFVKNEWSKLQEDGINERAEYVFNTMIEIVLSEQRYKEKTKLTDYQQFFITLKNEGVPVYEKADRESTIIMRTPPGTTRVGVLFSTVGLNDEKLYWYVNHSDYKMNNFIYGYIDSVYVAGEN